MSMAAVAAPRIATNNVSDGLNVALAKETLRNADAVCFDFDSTLICEEGIDELAKYCGAGEAVATWTKKAMDGGTRFQDALAARLDLIKPSRQDVEQCLIKHPPLLSPRAAEFVQSLRMHGKAVHIVSGGFRAMIEPVAATELGVSANDILANTIYWDEAGNYAGFNPNEMTAADGGKPKAIAHLKRTRGYNTVVMIGDGATDAQAKPPADAFIGYGGVVQRQAVVSTADWFVLDFADLIAALQQS